jgi:hypothetical protein
MVHVRPTLPVANLTKQNANLLNISCVTILVSEKVVKLPQEQTTNAVIYVPCEVRTSYTYMKVKLSPHQAVKTGVSCEVQTSSTYKK